MPFKIGIKNTVRRKKLKEKLNKKIRKFNIILILTILIVAIYFAPKVLTSARYVFNATHENYFSSKDFYFSSDKLTIEGTEYQVTDNWTGASSHDIPVTVSSKENDKLFTLSDISYTIRCTSCSDNIECTPSKLSGTIVGKDNSGSNMDSFAITVTPKNNTPLNDGAVAWVNVLVTSTSPYIQELRGKLIIQVGTADVYYEIVDAVDSPYLTVNITNSQATAASVTLSYNPQNVLVDMTSHFYLDSTATTDQTLNGYLYLNTITSPVGALSTTSVKFYKNNPGNNYSYLSGSSGTPIITMSY